MGEYAKAEPLLSGSAPDPAEGSWAGTSRHGHSLNNLALVYQDMHEYAKAEPLFQEALRIRQKVLGSEHPYTATSLNNLAVLYQDMHEYAKAEPLLTGGAPDPAEGSWARTSRHGA